MYDKLVTKGNNIDTSKYDRDKPDLEKKILNINGLVKKQILMLNYCNRKQST